jgi:phenylacetic acid degradation operon negative regulatory protein
VIPPASAGEVPRHQDGARPQRLLSTLLGDYWFARSEYLPSSALREVLACFAISETGARAAIQRLAHRGMLVAERRGRRTAYAVAPSVLARLERTIADLFAAPYTSGWDGRWSVVTFTVPEERQSQRRAFRQALRKHGYGALFDAVWVAPYGASEDAIWLAAECGVSSVASFETSDIRGLSAREIVSSAFDVERLAAEHATFLARWADVRVDDVRGPDALVMRTDLMSEWRAIVRRAPRLPRELLPEVWPGAQAYECCARLYDALGPEAESAMRRIIEKHDAVLAGHVSHHTFSKGARSLTLAPPPHPAVAELEVK